MILLLFSVVFANCQPDHSILLLLFFFFNQNIYEKEFDSSVAFKSKCNLIAILVKCLFLSYYSCKEEINFSLFIMNLMGKLRIRR